MVTGCPSMSGSITLRHHAVVRFLETGMVRRGYRVLRERTLASGGRRVRPDLLVSTGDELLIFDVSIVGGRRDREEAGQAKVRKYAKEWIFKAAQEALGGAWARRRVVPVILSWKGLWSVSSYRTLRGLRVSDRICLWIMQRVVRGGLIIFNSFQRRAAGGP